LSKEKDKAGVSTGRPAVAHYSKGKLEPWDVILDWEMNFWAGNVLKYLNRYRYKGTPVQDLEKAADYLNELLVQEKDKVGGGE
jgi:hypothetical protein